MKIQASITSYFGEPATVLSLWHQNVLVVSKVVKYRKDRYMDSLIIADSELEERESFFTDEHMGDAIEAYYFMKNCGELVIEDVAAMANPENSIQPADTNNGQNRYMVKPELSNLHVATLATCWQVKRSKGIAKNLSMFDQLLSARGTIATI